MRRYKGTRGPLIERPSSFHSFARRFIPWLGVSELEKAVVNLSATMEAATNLTAGAIRAQQEELKAFQKWFYKIG